MEHPGARRAGGAVSLDGDFVIHDGFGIGNSLAPNAVATDIWRWQGRWVPKEFGGSDPRPPGARYPGLCPDGEGGFFRFGGCGHDGTTLTFSNALWHWKHRWRLISEDENGPPGRYTSALARHQEAIFVFAGNRQQIDRQNTYFGDLWSFAGGRWTRIHDETSGPGRRYGFGWTQVKDQLYVFGGYDGRSDLSDFWRLDLSSLTWSRLPEAPPARYCPAIGVCNQQIILFGGRSKTNARLNYADTWVYDGCWREWKGASPGYHAKAAYATTPEGLWIYGGEGPCGHLSDTWRFDVNGWTCMEAARHDDPVFW